MFTKGDVSRAGEVLACAAASSEDRRAAMEVVSWWRAAHDEPLREMLSVVDAACETIQDSLVVGRLKRVPTIIEKLQRPNHTFDLKTLDDIAGCRIVLPRCDQIVPVSRILKGHKSFHGAKDYLHSPKANGYRGIHSLHRCDSLNNGLQNLRVEVQVRSAKQHAWSTAVESYDVIARSNLKTDEGNSDERRFFALISSLIAIEENAEPIPGVDISVSETVRELKTLEPQLHIISKLRGFSQSVFFINEDDFFEGSEAFLLNFDDELSIQITGYMAEEWQRANQEYALLEEAKEGQGYTLLVKSRSISDLEIAYPNYFSDISKFLGWLQGYME